VPRPRDHPVGFGYRNYFLVVKHGHGAACSQVTVERVIKITSVELVPTDSRTSGSRPVMASRATALDLRLEQCRRAYQGSAAPMKMFLRVISVVSWVIVSLRFSQFWQSARAGNWNKSPVRVSIAGQCKVRPPMKPAAVLLLGTNPSSSSMPPPTLQRRSRTDFASAAVRGCGLSRDNMRSRFLC